MEYILMFFIVIANIAMVKHRKKQNIRYNEIVDEYCKAIFKD